MLFWLVDIVETSRALVYVFSNDNTVQMSVRVANCDAFRLPFIEHKSYNISLRCNHDTAVPYHVASMPQFLGVVIKTTRNSVHVASGSMLWKFPRSVCHSAFQNGSDVWIRVRDASV